MRNPPHRQDLEDLAGYGVVDDEVEGVAEEDPEGGEKLDLALAHAEDVDGWKSRKISVCMQKPRRSRVWFTLLCRLSCNLWLTKL